MLISRRNLLKGATAFAGFGTVSQGWSTQRPARSIKVICAYAPGGLVDLFARTYGGHLSKRLGHPVNIENRPGASGIIAAKAMMDAPHDGHTLMFTLSSALISNRVLFETLPYDPEKDFAFISSMSAGQLPLVVHTSTGVRSLADLAALAKRSNLSFGSFGPGSYAHIVAAELNRKFGCEMRPVHYRGEAPMWQDLASGQIQIATGTFAGASRVIQSGAGRAIAVSDLTRMSKLPDVPTYAEQGLTSPAFKLKGFVCFVGPAAMPRDSVTLLSRFMVEAGETREVKNVLEAYGIDEAAADENGFKRLLAEQTGPWIELVRGLELTPHR